MVTTRRLAAIMFTDMVGFTALAQTNEAAALKLLHEQEKLVRPVLAEHHGREIKSTGDGFLVEFGSALLATECAIDIQRRVNERNARVATTPIELRIGLHLGDVERRKGDVLGDAVNVASRIVPLADPGGVCLSGQVLDHVQNKVTYRFDKLSAPVLKGLRGRMDVYRVVMPWDVGETGAGSPARPRVAVLPLANISPDPKDEYFADGLTEELISTISKVPELSVISRTSVMHYKSPIKPMAEIGRELGASTILEGSVRKAGDRVRVAVQLIDAVGDRHLWAENYDRSLDDVFAIQSEIAQKVANALQVRLLDSDQGRISKAPTEVTEAHLLYMKGAFRFQRLTKGELETAIGFFEKAVQKDPRYALAYAAMGGAYSFLGLWEMIPSQEAYANVERAARRALEYDDSLAEAHLIFGYARFYNRDWAGARKELQRALELNPNLPGAHLSFAFVHLAWGQTQRAISHAQRAMELDPLSASTMQVAASVFLYGGLPELAIPLFKKALKLNPESSFARANLGLCYVQQGKPKEGIEEIQKAVQMSARSNPAELADLAYAFSRAGRLAEAQKIIGELLEIHGRRGTGAVSLAYAYASVGDADRAFEWLEEGLQEGSGSLGLFAADFSFKSLSTDPRFQRFVEKVGLPLNR